MNITPNFSSYSASYYANNLLQNAKSSLWKACPLTSWLPSLGSSALTIFPEYIFSFINDALVEDEPNSTEQMFFANKSSTKEITEFYLKNSVHIDQDLEGKEELESQIETHLMSRINLYKEVVENLNNSFNKSAQLAFEFPQPGESYYPCSTYGCSLSTANPLLKVALPPVHAPTKAHVNAYQEAYNNALKDGPEKVQFVYTHEFMHLLNDDLLTRSACALLTSAMSSLPWVIGFTQPVSWASYLLTSSAQSFLIETISAFTQDILIRHQERRSDLQALDHLGDSEGAEKFFLTLPGIGHKHPPTQERLEYARAFKPLSKRQAV